MHLDAKKVATLAVAIVTVCLLVLVVFGLSRTPPEPVTPQVTPQTAVRPQAPPQQGQGGASGAGQGAPAADGQIAAGNAGQGVASGGQDSGASGTPGGTGSTPSGHGSAGQGNTHGSAGSGGGAAAGGQTPAGSAAQDAAGGQQGGLASTPGSVAGMAQPQDSARQPFSVPPAKNNAALVFIIDDGGMSVANVRRYTELPFPLTVAVLPGLSHSAECAQVVRSAGKELILHQPMQSLNLSLDPGPGAITPDMGGSQIERLLDDNIRELGGVSGFNNHEGSLITEDLNKMTFVLGVAKSHGIYFLDSRTTANSTARQAALEHDMTIYERNAPFLDNTLTRQAMLEELYKGLAVANRSGYAVIIGHVDKSAAILPQLLADIYPYLVQQGYVLTTLSMLNY